MQAKGTYGITREETYHNGQVIFEDGDSRDCLYIILKGSVEISKNAQRREYIIEKLKPGEIFGEMELIGDTERNVNARAIGETSLGVLDQESFEREFSQLSRQFRSILETIPLRLKKMVDRACDLSS
ncbi:MAG: cyclic nucleotide-binding domain-containing protein [Deltaproteobacteria bacterium]|nr:cyclic nucleotide-binding domain-containing protein [Deltaproteobacteria bacterium]